MKVVLLFPGNLRPRELEPAAALYLERLVRGKGFEALYYRQEKSGAQDEDRVREEEGSRLLRKVAQDDYLVLCDERGKMLDTGYLAEFLRCLRQGGGVAAGRKRVVIALGGPLGVSDAVRKRADEIWSLSGLVLAGGIARILLLEGLYRARCILDGHPYHNA